MNWIINNSIVFRPGSKCLTSLNDPDKKIILTSPASHCLLILLEAAPNIVSHQELFKKVWEDNGLIVPVNTLYHNISTIRRGLRDAGMPDNFIMTVSRKGFQIAENADLQRVDASELAAFGAPIKTPSPPSSEDVIDDTINIPSAEDGSRHNSAGYLVCIMAAIGLAILGSYLLTSFMNNGKEENYFRNYRFVEQVQNCHFFVKDVGHENSNGYENYKSLILNSSNDCKKYPWIYFMISSTSPSSIIFACKKNYQQATHPDCITFSFRETSDE